MEFVILNAPKGFKKDMNLAAQELGFSGWV